MLSKRMLSKLATFREFLFYALGSIRASRRARGSKPRPSLCSFARVAAVLQASASAVLRLGPSIVPVQWLVQWHSL
jgi:hypothetical protein